VFAVPLNLLVQQEGTVIPKLVSQSVKYLEKGKMQYLGSTSLLTPEAELSASDLFQLSPNKSKVKYLKKLYDKDGTCEV
jgi:hypothetical protein